MAGPSTLIRRLAMTAALGFALATPSYAAAQTAIDTDRGTAYYAGHASAAVILGVAAALPARPRRGGSWVWGGFDTSVQSYFSEGAAQTSDMLVMLSAVGLPVASQLALGVDTSLGNASVVYAEAQAANLALNRAVKLAVGRPRPYVSVRRNNKRVAAYYRLAGDDAYVSFYSGHSSTAFTAATASSILFSLRSQDAWQRHFAWGIQFAVAGATADLRVAAGRHYRSDVLVGTLAGIALGVGLPAAHKLDLAQVKPTELAVGSGAAALGIGLVEILRPQLNRNASVEPPSKTSWVLLPAPIGSSPGVVAFGDF